MGDWSDKFKFSRNDCLGEVTFADKVWHDVNIVAFDHVQDFSQAWFLFPKTAINFREKAAPNNLVRMLKGWRTRIGVQRRAMTYQNEGTLPLVRHVPKLDVSPMFLKWNSRSGLAIRSREMSRPNRQNLSVANETFTKEVEPDALLTVTEER